MKTAIDFITWWTYKLEYLFIWIYQKAFPCMAN